MIQICPTVSIMMELKNVYVRLILWIVLSLSVFFTTQDPILNFTDIVITSNADISQGFSFRRTHNTIVYYEHQLSVSFT
jgi:hypothetical protein